MARHTRRPTGLKTLSVKVPAALSARVVKLAKSRRPTVSAVVREAIERYAPEEGASFHDAAPAFIGCLDAGPGDLATNPKHLKCASSSSCLTRRSSRSTATSRSTEHERTARSSSWTTKKPVAF